MFYLSVSCLPFTPGSGPGTRIFTLCYTFLCFSVSFSFPISELFNIFSICCPMLLTLSLTCYARVVTVLSWFYRSSPFVFTITSLFLGSSFHAGVRPSTMLARQATTSRPSFVFIHSLLFSLPSCYHHVLSIRHPGLHYILTLSPTLIP